MYAASSLFCYGKRVDWYYRGGGIDSTATAFCEKMWAAWMWCFCFCVLLLLLGDVTDWIAVGRLLCSEMRAGWLWRVFSIKEPLPCAVSVLEYLFTHFFFAFVVDWIATYSSNGIRGVSPAIGLKLPSTNDCETSKQLSSLLFIDTNLVRVERIPFYSRGNAIELLIYHLVEYLWWSFQLESCE